MKNRDILIADDEANIRTTLKGILEDEGYDIVTVENGLKAVEAAKNEAFSLILMDIVMPGLNGVEAMKDIKKVRPTIVIIMTGHTDEEDLLQEARSQGAKAIVYKPIQIPVLLGLIKTALDGEENVSD